MAPKNNDLDLRNVGPETQEWLEKIGVTTNKQFFKLGPERTYILLLEAGHPHDPNLRYVLIGAQEDIDWHLVAHREQEAAKSRFADIDES